MSVIKFSLVDLDIVRQKFVSHLYALFSFFFVLFVLLRYGALHWTTSAQRNSVACASARESNVHVSEGMVGFVLAITQQFR